MNAFGTQLHDPIKSGLVRWHTVVLNNKLTPPRNSGGIPQVSTIFSLSIEMSRLTRDGTVEPVSRDHILRRERGQGNTRFPCLADHEQDWQPHPVDPLSCYMCDHTYIQSAAAQRRERHRGFDCKCYECLLCVGLDPVRLTLRICFGAMCSESAFATADFDCSEFAHIREIEDCPIRFTVCECSQHRDIWNGFDFPSSVVCGSRKLLHVLKRGSCQRMSTPRPKSGPETE